MACEYAKRRVVIYSLLLMVKLSVAVMLTYLQNNLLLACDCLSLRCLGLVLCNDSRVVKHVLCGQLRFCHMLCTLVSALEGAERSL